MEKISNGGLAELFRRDYLVAPKQTSVVKEEIEITSSLLVVITNVAPSAEDMTLLGNILKAVNIDVSGISIVQGLSFETVVEKYHPKHLISFGKSAFDLGIQSVQIDLYSPKEYEGVPVLIADPISKISVSQDKKKALWLNLKRIFNI